MEFKPIVAVKIVNSDGSFSVLKEGDEVSKVVYKENGEQKTLTGVCRVIDVATKAYSAGPTTCPPDPFFDTVAVLNTIIFDISDEFNAKLKRINITDIVSINIAEETDVVVDVASGESVATVLSTVEENATVEIKDGEVAENLVLDKGVVIEGAHSGEPQNFNQEV